MKHPNIKKLFIVDDDRVWASILRSVLENLGYTQITHFESGQACVKNMNLRPDLIFLDYQMEQMNGLEVLQQIKAIYPEARVVFCTSNDELNVAVSALRNGSSDFLLKTKCNTETIRQVVHESGEAIRFADKVF